ncbi:FadR/GntR family transcriptional regulator [Streptomyces sp. NPDC058457]|uniref:FadR/GntR family transcriptional regulator n=1 Tax=Streptomyces sp. NPDC058457 TaxID=3346507 RepID=UPI00365E8F2B
MSVEYSLRTLVRDGLRSGTLGPGAQLPTERTLVERFAAPRSAVRRALDVLEQEGLVVRHVGRGTFLTEAAVPPADVAPADTSPAEIMQVRLLIEPPVAALAAGIATQADLDRIAVCLDRGGRSDDHGEFESWDTRLHHAIAQAAHNSLLISMFDVMNTARALPIWGSLKRRTSTPERLRCYHAEHTAVVEALRDRDSESAQDAMRRHLMHVADNLLGRH